VLIGDGYTADERGAWVEHVDRMTEQLLTTAEPYDRYRRFINVYRVDVESRESGIDDPERGVFVDTALDGTNSCEDYTVGLCQTSWQKTHAAIDAATPGIPVHWRHVVLHTDIFLGGAHYPAEGTLAVYASDVAKSFNIATHEAGHGFHRLGDEYVNPGFEEAVYDGQEPAWPNLSVDATGSKWEAWIGFAQPELGGPVGAYEGGLTNAGKGVWRPSPQSRMNHFVHQLDAVGKEVAILSIYRIVRPIDEWRDTSSPVGDCEPLWLRVVDPAVVMVEWVVDGVPIDATGEELDVCALGLAEGPGPHTVSARAYDEVLDHTGSDNEDPHPLDLVRRELPLLEQSVQWTVQIR